MCYIDEYYDKSSNSCLKISGTCKEGEYYDEEINRCLVRCGENYVINKTSNRCQPLTYVDPEAGLPTD